MLQVLWEYRVRADRVSDFEAYYKGSGTWAQFFAKGEGYRGTNLLHDRESKLRYFTVDRWESIELYERFKRDFAEEYAKHDKHCEQFTSDEKLLGYFEVVE
jgi:heme-degrading monooxygenase HmoA